MAFILYHWSPVSRRKQILKQGLCPNKISRCGQWKPPYICFSQSPSTAWGASAMMDRRPMSYDLWMLWSDHLEGYETLKLGNNTEYRVYHRIPKRNIWLVGTREYIPRKS